MRTIPVLAGVLALVTPALAAAQTISVDAGLTLGSLSSYESQDVNQSFGTTQRPAFAVELLIGVPVSKTVSFEGGAGFVQKGAKLTPGVTASNTVAEAMLSYLEFPVLLRFEGGGDGIRPFVHG